MDLHNLSHLFLHGNRLWSLNQNTFRGLRALDRLLLHQNQIEWVDRLAFHDLKHLTTLYLFNNTLVQLSGQCLDTLPALEYLRLNDNPWSCDCKALSLWEWLKRFRGSTSSVGCQAPAEVLGKDLKDLRKEDFPNCSPTLPNSESRAQTNNLSGTVNPSANRGVVVGSGGQTHIVHPSRPGRSRNCTKPRVRGKGKGDNEVHHSKEVIVDKDDSSPDFTDGGKHDHTSPDGTVTRRKHKCTPRTTVRPPSGVQQANNRATFSQSLLHVCALLTALITTNIDFILRWPSKGLENERKIKKTALRPSLAPALPGLCVFYVCVRECDYLCKCSVGSFRLKQASRKHQTSTAQRLTAQKSRGLWEGEYDKRLMQTKLALPLMPVWFHPHMSWYFVYFQLDFPSTGAHTTKVW